MARDVLDPNPSDAIDVVVEKHEIRDARSGERLGTLADPSKDDHRLACFAADLVDAAHGRFRARGRDLKDPAALRLLSDARGNLEPEFIRLMAGNAGDLAIKDVVTAGTRATYLMSPIEAAADLVCPVTLVSKPFGSWLADNVSTDIPTDLANQGVSAGGSPAVISPQLTSALYDASAGQAFSVMFPTELFANSDIDLTKLAIRRLCNVFKIRREKRCANLLTLSTSFAAANRTAATAKWDQAFATTTALPLDDCFTAIQPSLHTPTHFVFTEALAHKFFADNRVYQFLTAVGESRSRVFPEIIIGTMRQTVAGVVNYVWGSQTSANGVFVYAPEDQPEAVATARTLRYVGTAPDAAQSTESNGFLLRRVVEQKHGARGAISYVLAANDIELVLNNQLGAILTGIGA